MRPDVNCRDLVAFWNFNCTQRAQNYLIELYARVLGWLARTHKKNAIGKQDKYFQRNQWLCSCDVSLHSSMRCYYYLYFYVKWTKERDRFRSLAHREWEQWPIHLRTWQIVSFTFCLRALVCTSLCLCTMFDASRRQNETETSAVLDDWRKRQSEGMSNDGTSRCRGLVTVICSNQSLNIEISLCILIVTVRCLFMEMQSSHFEGFPLFVPCHSSNRFRLS